MLAELSLLEPLESRLLLSKPLPSPLPEQLCPRHPHRQFSQALKEEFANSALGWLPTGTLSPATSSAQVPQPLTLTSAACSVSGNPGTLSTD